jgi:hypothetical protein
MTDQPPEEPTTSEPDEPTIKPADVTRTPKPGPKWETEAKEKLRTAVRRYAKPLADLVARDANEGDTRLLVTDFLCEGLGYDKYENLTTEYQVKGEFADYGVRIDKDLVAFIEVKRCTTKLGEKHLRQVQMYAANEGVEWMFLTNGVVWQVYHLTAGLPLVTDLALEVDLLDETVTPAKKVAELFYVTLPALKRRQIDELWQAKAATSPKAIAKALLSEPVVDALRKEIRRVSGHNAESKTLAAAIRDGVIRPECLS